MRYSLVRQFIVAALALTAAVLAGSVIRTPAAAAMGAPADPSPILASAPIITATNPTTGASQTAIAAAQDSQSTDSLSVTVTDTSPLVPITSLTATSSNSALLPQSAVNLIPTGIGTWTLSVTTPSTPGVTAIVLTATDATDATATQSITYGVSAPESSLVGAAGSPVYFEGAGNASTEVSVGDGYDIAGDGDTNVLHLYSSAGTSEPLASYDFTAPGTTDSGLPDGTSSIDIEAAASTGTAAAGDEVIYWFGSQSSSNDGAGPPATDTVFATEVLGEGANAQLEYLGSYTGLRSDLINWDMGNGNPLGLSAAAAATPQSTAGLDLEGVEFAPGSTSTVYLAFRAPLEPYSGDSPSQDAGAAGQDALLVPLTNLPSLIQSGLATGQSADVSSAFGSAIEPQLGGLGVREIRENADGQYLLVAGTSGPSNSRAALYAWDGQPHDPPVLTRTTLPVDGAGDWAWEGITTMPAPAVDGSTVQLVEDDGNEPWYGDGQTANTDPALNPALQKDLEADFTLELATQSVSFSSSPPSPATAGGTYTVAATATSGLPVALTVDPSSTTGACSIAGATVSLSKAGTCLIDANQAGNYGYDAAAQVEQSFEVSPDSASTITGTTTMTTTTTTTTTTGTTSAPTATTPIPANPAFMASATDKLNSAPQLTASSPNTVTATVDAGNQKISLTITKVVTCLARTTKLKVVYQTATLSGSSGPELTYVGANLLIDKKVRAVARATKQTFQVKLNGLKRGLHTLRVDSIYHYMNGREDLTLTKTQTHRFKVC